MKLLRNNIKQHQTITVKYIINTKNNGYCSNNRFNQTAYISRIVNVGGKIMKKITISIFSLLLALTMVVLPVKAYEQKEFNIITEVKEYGQVVTKLVVKYDQVVTKEELSKDLYTVKRLAADLDDNGQAVNNPIETEIAVTGVSVANDEVGTEAKKGNYVVINLEYGADKPNSNTLNFRFPEFHNHLMTLTYTVTQTKDFNGTETGLLKQGKTINLAVDDYTSGKSSSGLDYRAFAPKADDHKNALVIWFHGAGEGGTNNVSQLAGNEGAVAFSRDYQDIFDGAYVLAPQTPTFWVTDTDNGSGVELKAEKDYTADVISLIKEYLANNPDIDPSRVYVGGCSKGGWQTISTLLAAPELFAAAFPICPAYTPEESKAADFSKLKDMPIWVVHAKDDKIVTIDYSKTLVERLKAAKAKVTYTTYTDEYDMNGTITNIKVDGILYNNHFSWVPALNNLPVNEDGVHLINWIAAQSKTITADSKEDSQDVKPTAPKTGDDSDLASIGVLFSLSLAGCYLVIKKGF